MIAGSAFRQASNAGLRSYGWGVVGFGALTVLALQQVPGFVEFYEQLLSPRLLLPILIATTFFYGAVLACSTRESHFLQRFLIQREYSVLRKLAFFCGCIFGWALAVCLVHIAINGPASAPWAVVLASYAAIFTLFPIWAFANVLVISKVYREFTIREKPWHSLITASGWALIAISVAFGYQFIF